MSFGAGRRAPENIQAKPVATARARATRNPLAPARRLPALAAATGCRRASRPATSRSRYTRR